jgi:phage tail-like protein
MTFSSGSAIKDPYKNFRFRVRWDDKVVAGISRISALRRTTSVMEHRAGDEPSPSHKSPGRTSFEAITLERGLTDDLDFHQWALKVWNAESGGPIDDFHKDILIEFCNDAGKVVITFLVRRCWVSAFQALPELDALGNGVAIESITLEHEGWERI